MINETVPLRDIAFSRLRGFAKMMNSTFDTEAQHIKQIAQALEDVEEGKIKRLMIFMPPRHGKSMITSEIFPAWYLGRNPTHKIMFVTYAQEFAEEFGRKVRNQVADADYQKIFPTTLLAKDSAAVKKFNTTKGGAYYAVGIGGPVTGRGAHILLIDDPVKNRAEADSSLIRQKHKEWFSSTANTRLEPNGAIIIVQTRWHHDDLSGWLLEEKKQNWHVISLPALSKNEQGEYQAIWPERYSVEHLLQIKEDTLTHDWNALYMQSPVEIGGGTFKGEWLKFYDSELSPIGMNVYIFVDPANSKDKYSDNTAICVIATNKDGKLYVLDMYIDKFNYKERQDLLFDLVMKYKPQNMFIEEYGMQVDIQHMEAEMERRNYRFNIESVGGNKLKKNDRILRLVPYFQEGKIYLPRFLTKTNYLGSQFDVVNYFMTKEYTQFTPNLTDQKDDMLDCMSRIFDVSMMYPGGEGDVDYHRLYR
jgi:predicted phage terminase large subunit-like protein